METIRFTLESNSEIWSIIDQTADHVLVHNFQPNAVSEWWTSSIQLKSNFILENVSIRNLQFDLQTTISGLRQILEQETDFLDIYQFDRPVSDTMVIGKLPEATAERILIQNGLQHIIKIYFESITLSSVNPEYIRSIVENPLFAERIQANSLKKD